MNENLPMNSTQILTPEQLAAQAVFTETSLFPPSNPIFVSADPLPAEQTLFSQSGNDQSPPPSTSDLTSFRVPFDFALLRRKYYEAIAQDSIIPFKVIEPDKQELNEYVDRIKEMVKFRHKDPACYNYDEQADTYTRKDNVELPGLMEVKEEDMLKPSDWLRALDDEDKRDYQV